MRFDSSGIPLAIFSFVGAAMLVIFRDRLIDLDDRIAKRHRTAEEREKYRRLALIPVAFLLLWGLAALVTLS
ncbi:hypothetical protein GCM10022234_23750 [Aeromicrobium panaciterrae]|uniref:hypothetical protein n=1 Tax=Aeromicrobium panaciterrae TaxID=363861 RepID=UPI0031D6048E